MTDADDRVPGRPSRGGPAPGRRGAEALMRSPIAFRQSPPSATQLPWPGGPWRRSCGARRAARNCTPISCDERGKARSPEQPRGDCTPTRPPRCDPDSGSRASTSVRRSHLPAPLPQATPESHSPPRQWPTPIQPSAPRAARASDHGRLSASFDAPRLAFQPCAERPLKGLSACGSMSRHTSARSLDAALAGLYQAASSEPASTARTR